VYSTSNQRANALIADYNLFAASNALNVITQPGKEAKTERRYQFDKTFRIDKRN